MKTIKVFGIFLLIMTVMPSQVFAHAEWTKGSTTPPRQNENIKAGKCSGNRSTPQNGLPRLSIKAGSQLSVNFNEFVLHYGYFDINFSTANDLNFKKIHNQPHNQINEAARTSPPDYKITLNMPLELCNDCTLQLIQEMWPEKTYIRPTNLTLITYYHSCTDIELTPPNPGLISNQDPITIKPVTIGSRNITLNWINPTNFYKILIVSNVAGTVPTTTKDLLIKQYKFNDTIIGSNNDKVVYVGKANSASISQLTNGSEYNYRIFAYDINLNYSSAVSINAIPTGANVAPTVSLDVNQSGKLGTTVLRDGTDIIVTATVVDGNQNNGHTYTWSSNDFIDSDAIESTFTIQGDTITTTPVNMTYNISVTATDSGGLSGSNSTEIILKEKSSAINPNTPATTNSAGGCSMSTTAKFDPLLLFMAILSLIIIGLKFRKH